VSPSVPPLAAYGIDIEQTSVSGVSSGGAMAVQMHVAHSSIMRGVGVIAGVAYDCADSSLPLAMQRLSRGLAWCLPGFVDAAFSIARTAHAAGIAGAIDDTANLARQKIWLFSGYNDGFVRRAAMDAVAGYYENYVDPGNIFYKTNNHAPHALVTDDYGGPCLGRNDEHVNNCNYDAAGRLLKHIYGQLNQRSSSLTGSLLTFDQREFINGDPQAIGLADTGYVYVPTACRSETCRVHVVFHGCKQDAAKVGGAVYRHGGYNKWADTNKLVVLYPQTQSNPDLNPQACWDWWGLGDLPRYQDFARKTGYQVSAIKAMLDRLAQGFVPSGKTDTFGTPQAFVAEDSTPSSVALIWQPNNAATGFNVYRAASSAGPYTKINSQPVSGASFADRGLSANATHYYKVSALGQGGSESAPTSPMSGATAAPQPACDPYFSDNMVHVAQGRAWSNVFNVFALGSNDAMGPNSSSDFSHLFRQGTFLYRVGYCP
jgi:poly(3-hydroxybutyrate) depolymerase